MGSFQNYISHESSASSSTEGGEWEEEKEEKGEFGKECVEFISCSATLKDSEVMAESEHTVVWNMEEKLRWLLLSAALCRTSEEEGVHHGRAPAKEDSLQAKRQRQS